VATGARHPTQLEATLAAEAKSAIRAHTFLQPPDRSKQPLQAELLPPPFNAAT